MHAVLICPPLPSHLRAFEALAAELTRRGHRATFVTEPGVQLQSDVAQVTLPGGPVARQPKQLIAEILTGARRTDRFCQDAPAVIRSLQPDVILGDQMEPAAGLLARFLRLPLASVACAVPMENEPGIPLPFLGWPYDTSLEGLRRNAGGARVAGLMMTPHAAVIRRWALRWGLTQRTLQDCISDRLTLSQMAPGFDYPRPRNGQHIFEIGPFRRGESEQPFPNDIVPDPARPLVYASLGTLQGHRAELLSRISVACRRAGAQVLVSHAGCLTDKQARDIPADWVRHFVPQRAVLARADLCVTHAGLNTALECLTAGVPMLALPLTHDQPGVAARIVHHGVGLRLTRFQRGAAQIEAAVRRLLTDPVYQSAVSSFAADAPSLGGAKAAIDAVEGMLGTVPHGFGLSSGPNQVHRLD
ncbi:MAG: zeaxanthin glucosyltransferase [Paracoccus denitrificans]|nr:MAG: zeaxanthin glucosyltransferase [Paracoccus denitrificans]PZO84795.1 MAG: zeaxanthin glucosyltransferase [Paracoccus denitrificans]